MESMLYQVTARSIQELGKRNNQEDSIFPPLTDEPSGGSLFILCDGMGGHAAGEVASATVCEAMSQYIAAHPRTDGLFDESDFYAALDAAYDALDAKDTDDEKKMGTTLTFVKFHEGGCFIAHIGDSRIYHVRPSEHRLLHVTRDHSLVNDLVKLGEMTPEEAKTSRQKNVITRAVQPHQERRTKADCLNITDLQVGDIFYMCSDGMLEQAEDEEIVNTLSLPRGLEELIRILKGVTMENKDNHSAHLIRIVGIGEEKVEAIPVVPEMEDEPIVPEKPAPMPAPAPESPRSKLNWLAPLVVLGVVALLLALHPWSARGPKDNFLGIVPNENVEPVAVPVAAEASEPQQAVAPVPQGVLQLSSEPAGAAIWLDGKDTGKKTPAVFSVDKGVHAFGFVLDGYAPSEGRVTVTPPYESSVFRVLLPVL